MSIAKLKALYVKLSPGDQREALYQLTQSTKKMNVDTGKIIADFCADHQKEFKRDATFKIQLIEAGFIATVQTAYGKFTGAGPYKKIAKLNAIREAEESRKDPVAKAIEKNHKKPAVKRKSTTKTK